MLGRETLRLRDSFVCLCCDCSIADLATGFHKELTRRSTMTIQSSVGIASLVIAGAIAGTLGCAGTSDYVYQPDTANATAGGLPATRTPIPQEAPQGAIEVVSYGVTNLQRE